MGRPEVKNVGSVSRRGRTDEPVVTHNDQGKVFLRMWCKMMDLLEV